MYSLFLYGCNLVGFRDSLFSPVMELFAVIMISEKGGRGNNKFWVNF